MFTRGHLFDLAKEHRNDLLSVIQPTILKIAPQRERERERERESIMIPIGVHSATKGLSSSSYIVGGLILKM